MYLTDGGMIMDQNITLKIVDRTFKLKVSSPENEELMRKAAGEINEKFRKFQEKNPSQPVSDIMCLVTLRAFMQNIGLAGQLKTMEAEADGLANEIEVYLNENE